MITPYLPLPGYSGGQTRSYSLLKHLSKKCQVTLISFILPGQDPESIKHLKKYCRKIITVKRGKTWTIKKILLTGSSFYPFLVVNYFSSKLKGLLKEELKTKTYDLVHVECFYLMPNIPKTKTPVLLVDQTIEFAVYQHFVEALPGPLKLLKSLLWFDVLKLKLWETKFWKKADCLVAVSKEDQKIMKKLSKKEAEIVPNGVDGILTKAKKVKKYPRPTILYGVANFKWMQNKEGAINLLRFVWPKIKKNVPRARLLIVGRHSVPFISSLKWWRKTNDVIVKDIKDSEKVYRQSWVLVAPIKSGGGSRTKFFEAMACGLPIVTTPEGAEGIEAKPNQGLIVADNFNGLIAETVKLIKRPKFREKIGQEGRKLVKLKYSWQKSAKKLLKIYQEISKNG